jgi:hypothetical protein
VKTTETSNIVDINNVYLDDGVSLKYRRTRSIPFAIAAVPSVVTACFLWARTGPCRRIRDCATDVPLRPQGIVPMTDNGELKSPVIHSGMREHDRAHN